MSWFFSPPKTANAATTEESETVGEKYNPQKTVCNLETVANYVQAPTTDELTDIPGIGGGKFSLSLSTLSLHTLYLTIYPCVYN